MTSELKLLPCPFCGSDDIDPEGVFFYDGGDTAKPINAPACNKCSATSGKTVDDWNNRAEQTRGEVSEKVHVTSFGEISLNEAGAFYDAVKLSGLHIVKGKA